MFRRAVWRLFTISVKPTPNPDCLKFESEMVEFVPDGVTCDVPNRSVMERHPVSRMLFTEYPEIRALFIANTYVTVTKWHTFEWNGALEQSIMHYLNNYTTINGPVGPTFLAGEEEDDSDTQVKEGDDEVIQCIKELIIGNIRPMVQKDGGNVRYVTFNHDTGILKLKMQGACASCPSSQNTLQDGILRLLQHFLPEVKDVEEFKPKLRQAPVNDLPPSDDALARATSGRQQRIQSFLDGNVPSTGGGGCGSKKGGSRLHTQLSPDELKAARRARAKGIWGRDIFDEFE